MLPYLISFSVAYWLIATFLIIVKQYREFHNLGINYDPLEIVSDFVFVFTVYTLLCYIVLEFFV